MTPVQRGTGKQTELQAENMREFQEEEFEKQKCDYKEGGVRVHSVSSEQSPFSTALSV